MSNALATRPEGPSVLVTMAERYGMIPDAFERTLRATVVPADCSKEQFAAFLLVAKEYRLNPITREIFAFPTKAGGIQPIVSIDGWLNLANSHPQFDGIEFDDQVSASGELVAVTARIWRKDRSHPIVVTEYLEECFRPSSDVWRQWPRRMLRHKAAIQASRYAFGFSGFVDPDEAERIGVDMRYLPDGRVPQVSHMRDVSPPAAPAPKVVAGAPGVAQATRPRGRPRKDDGGSGPPEPPPIGEPVNKATAAGAEVVDKTTGEVKAAEEIKDPPSSGWREDQEAEAVKDPPAPPGRTELTKEASDRLREFARSLASKETSASVMREASRFYAENDLDDNDASPFAYAAGLIVGAHQRRTLGELGSVEADAIVKKALA